MQKKRGVLETGAGSYPLWIWQRLRNGGAQRIISLAARFLRPTLFLRRLALWLVRIFVLLESGVLLVIVLSLAALLLPPLALALLAFLVLTTAVRRRTARGLCPSLADRRVLLLDGIGRGEDLYFLHSSLDLSRRGYTVLLIGYPTGAHFLRELGDGVYAVAPSLYYTLRARNFFKPKRLISVSG